MTNIQKLKVVLIVLGSVVIDILLHVLTTPFSTVPENPDLSLPASILGIEITAILWALLAFSCAATVFFRIRKEIPGEGIVKGLRYGLAIFLLWLFAMLEGVSLFGNPVINEMIVGLSDAIPVLVMCLLLSKLSTTVEKNIPTVFLTGKQKVISILIFTGFFLAGRYVFYSTGVLHSGYLLRPLETFIWTLVMGAVIGVTFLLVRQRNARSLRSQAARFGLLIFGLNWAIFVIFIPLIFSGFLADAVLRIIIDIILIAIASFFSIISISGVTGKKLS
jgi:hypothetical protein